MVRSSFFEFYKINNGHAICAEIGVAGGYNAKEMLSHMRGITLYLIDPYIPYFSESEYEKLPDFHVGKMNEMMDLLKLFDDRIMFLRMDSVKASETFSDNYLDYVYIDGDHSEDAVRKDVLAWYPKVKVGGMLAGHDWCIVGEYIRELLPGIIYEDGEIKSVNTDWWVIKK